MDLKPAEENKKEVPQTNNNVPKEFLGDKTKTTVGKMSVRISEKLQQIKDMATMEVMLPVDVRMKHRLASIRKEGSAENLKIERHWKTTAPSMHITGLEGRKLTDTQCEIRFSIYKTDEKGDKELFTSYTDVTMHDGSTIKRPLSAEYRVAYEVIETINYRKPMTREVLEIETTRGN